MSMYYPEMGERPDASKLFHAFRVINGTMALKWAPERDEEARAAFKQLRIRPRNIEFTSASHSIRKRAYWSATCTYDAYRKARAAGLTCSEALLD